MELLLASASPSRRRLLEQAAIPHRVQVSGVDEDAIQNPNPLQLVQELAAAKAKAVQQILLNEKLLKEKSRNHPGLGILACDSMFEFDGEGPSSRVWQSQDLKTVFNFSFFKHSIN